MMKQTSKWREALGITPNNPFALIAVILTAISTITIIILFYYTFAGTTARIRFNYGTALLFVAALAPIPIVLLIIYARNYARIQTMVAGDYWAHWQYENEEVYISPLGIYYPSKKYTLQTFSHELQKVEIPSDSSVVQFNYLYLRKYSKVLPASRHNRTIVIPIPKGKETEAKDLVQRFQSEIGKPSKFIIEQLRIAWMMCFGIVGVVILWGIFLAIPLERDYRAEKSAQNDAYVAAQHEKKVAQLMPSLMPIRNVIDPQLEHLKIQPDGQMTAKEAGLGENSIVSKIIYGHCSPDNDFYLFVVLNKPLLEKTYQGKTGTFNYSTANGKLWGHRAQDCKPINQKLPDETESLTDGWYYAVVDNNQAIPSPSIAVTPKQK